MLLKDERSPLAGYDLHVSAGLGRVREVPFGAIFRGQLPDRLTPGFCKPPERKVPETVKVPLGENRIYLHIARQALDTHDAFCANALSENGGVRLNGRDPDFSRGLLPLSPQSVVVFLNQGLARRFDCICLFRFRNPVPTFAPRPA
jgi:hypothetical protein